MSVYVTTNPDVAKLLYINSEVQRAVQSIQHSEDPQATTMAAFHFLFDDGGEGHTLNNEVFSVCEALNIDFDNCLDAFEEWIIDGICGCSPVVYAAGLRRAVAHAHRMA